MKTEPLSQRVSKVIKGEQDVVGTSVGREAIPLVIVEIMVGAGLVFVAGWTIVRRWRSSRIGPKKGVKSV